MPISTPLLARRGLCLIAGVLTGCLLWAVYFQLGLVPSGVAGAVIRAVGRVMPQLGGDLTEWLAILLAFVVSAAPTALSIGLVAGVALRSSPHARWFFYAVLAFPLVSYLLTQHLLSQMEGVAGAQPIRSLWETRGTYVLAGLAIYGQFYVAAFVAGRLAARFARPAETVR